MCHGIVSLIPSFMCEVSSTLTKAVSLRVDLNIDGVSITSSSLSLGVPVPRATQCM
jgi:hypothetical protein